MPHLLLETGDVLLNENGLDGIGMEDGYASVISADSPLAHWRLNEPSGTTAYDRVAGRNGTYVNTPTLAVTGALYGDTDTAVTFTGASTEYVTVPNAAAFSLATTGELSVELWFKAATDDNFQLFTKGLLATFEIIVNRASGGQVRAFLGDGTTGIVIASAASSNLYAEAVWHHVVATFKVSTTTLVLYVNGLADNSDLTWSGSAVATANGIGMGQWPDGVTSGFASLDGSMDEVAVYPTALTAAQVLVHYDAGLAHRAGGARRVVRQAIRRASTI